MSKKGSKAVRQYEKKERQEKEAKSVIDKERANKLYKKANKILKVKMPKKNTKLPKPEIVSGGGFSPK